MSTNLSNHAAVIIYVRYSVLGNFPPYFKPGDAIIFLLLLRGSMGMEVVRMRADILCREVLP